MFELYTNIHMNTANFLYTHPYEWMIMFMFVMINFSNKHTKLNSLNLELTVLYFNKLLKINPNKLETPNAGHHSGN